MVLSRHSAVDRGVSWCFLRENSLISLDFCLDILHVDVVDLEYFLGIVFALKNVVKIFERISRRDTWREKDGDDPRCTKNSTCLGSNQRIMINY